MCSISVTGIPTPKIPSHSYKSRTKLIRLCQAHYPCHNLVHQSSNNLLRNLVTSRYNKFSKTPSRSSACWPRLWRITIILKHSATWRRVPITSSTTMRIFWLSLVPLCSRTKSSITLSSILSKSSINKMMKGLGPYSSPSMANLHRAFPSAENIAWMRVLLRSLSIKCPVLKVTFKI